MKSIGFKNFRRFENLPSLSLSPITLMVGKNNAGKSTVVKGLLALKEFFNENYTLRNRDIISSNDYESSNNIRELLSNIRFYFNSSYLAHIGTFKRAMYNKAPQGEDTIVFSTSAYCLNIDIEVKGDRNDEILAWGKVSKISLFHEEDKIEIVFNLLEDYATLTFYPITESLRYEKLSKSMQKKIAQYSSAITIKTSISKYWSLDWSPMRGFYIGSLLRPLLRSIEMAIDSSIPTNKSFDITKEASKNSRIRESMRYLSHRSEVLFNPIEGLNKEDLEFLKLYKIAFCKGERFRFSFPIYFSNFVNVEYIYAHAVTQTVIYSAKDTNDYLSCTIHEFASLQSESQNHKREFVIEWMKVFGIGRDFNIQSIGGEAHLVTITNQDGDIVNLADKGMGSIQLMVLLFRLAILLPEKSDSKRNSFYTPLSSKVIIIEEPEQNLHPMLQSKLADLFYQLYNEYGFRFLIETHSEYIIRRSQVLVSEAHYKDEEDLKQNPFKVYYFPEDGKPYDMKYLASGRFEETFGEGFFDEAGKWTRELIRSKRK